MPMEIHAEGAVCNQGAGDRAAAGVRAAGAGRWSHSRTALHISLVVLCRKIYRGG